MSDEQAAAITKAVNAQAELLRHVTRTVRNLPSTTDHDIAALDSLLDRMDANSLDDGWKITPG